MNPSDDESEGPRCLKELSVVPEWESWQRRASSVHTTRHILLGLTMQLAGPIIINITWLCCPGLIVSPSTASSSLLLPPTLSWKCPCCPAACSLTDQPKQLPKNPTGQPKRGSSSPSCHARSYRSPMLQSPKACGSPSDNPGAHAVSFRSAERNGSADVRGHSVKQQQQNIGFPRKPSDCVLPSPLLLSALSTHWTWSSSRPPDEAVGIGRVVDVKGSYSGGPQAIEKPPKGGPSDSAGCR